MALIARMRSRAYRWLMAFLKVTATELDMTTWTDNHTHLGIEASEEGLTLSVQVQTIRHRFFYGESTVVGMITACVIRQKLSPEMDGYEEIIDKFYGFSESGLIALLKLRLPSVERLPDGNWGEDRFYDRRRPAHFCE